jgi:hypothetical protein
MRRLSRLDRTIDRLRPRAASSSPSLLCPACLRRAPFSTSIRCFADPEEVSKTERLRRRIRETDEPPGLKDARAIKERLPKENQESQLQQSKIPTPILDASYEPAMTWDGLEEVGELPVPEFYFEGFMPAEKVTDRYEVTAALHRAVVEVFTLKQAGRPLSELSNANRGIDNTSGVQISMSQSNPSYPVLKFSAGASQEAILESLSQSEQDMEIMEAKEAAGSTEDVFEPETSDDASMRSKTIDPPTEDESPEAIAALQLRNYEHQVASWNPSWLQVSLEDAEIKFAVSEPSKFSNNILTECRLSSGLCSSPAFAFLIRP